MTYFSLPLLFLDPRLPLPEMNLTEFLDLMNRGLPVAAASEIHRFMINLSHEEMRITSELNGTYYDLNGIFILFSKLIGKPMDKSFGLFPPFYTDCGRNINRQGSVYQFVLSFSGSGCHNDCRRLLNWSQRSACQPFVPADRSMTFPVPIVISRADTVLTTLIQPEVIPSVNKMSSLFL
jgi:hypothetical protein